MVNIMSRKALKKLPRTPPKERDDAWATIRDAIEDVPVPELADGWAEPPWRSWRWAARLCLELWSGYRRTPMDAVEKGGDEAERAGSWLMALLDGISNDANEDYWTAADWRRALPQVYVDPPAAQALEAALAITQLGLSRSDGGGSAFTTRLADVFLAFLAADIDIAGDVLHARLRDALDGNHTPKRAAAFKAAWSLGHYRLAYLV